MKNQKFLNPNTYLPASRLGSRPWRAGNIKHNDRGFIALITVLIILGITLLVGLGAAQLSFGEIQMSLQKFQSSQSLYLANLCAEDALMKLKEDISYSGETISDIENGSCAILVDGNWTVNVSANFQNQIKKMKIVVSQINPEMIISSWQEVPEF